MIVNISAEDFATIIGTPSSQIAELFEKTQPFFAEAQSQLEKQLRYNVASIPNENYFISSVNSYIVLYAFYSAIPHIDLIWTPTGFGIVSNNTLAPASRDRIAELRSQLLNRACKHLHYLIADLMRIDSYVDSIKPISFIFSLAQYEYIAGEQTKPEEFSLFSANFKQPEHKLKRLIGADELDNLRYVAARQWLPSFDATPEERQVIDLITRYVVAAANNICTADEYLPQILAIVNDDKNLETFSRYATSSEYQANNFAHYENTADKPSFFFS